MFAVSILSAHAETPVTPGEVSGMWTEEASPYIIQGDITVLAGKLLKIMPGVTVQFAGSYSLTVNGTLEAGERQAAQVKQKEDDKRTVHFTTDPAMNPAGWGGLRFIRANDEGYLFGCVIENARAPGQGGGIYCEASELKVANCEIRNCEATAEGGGIAVIGKSKLDLANISLKNNTAGNRGGGLFAQDSEVNLANVSVERNRGGGLAVKNGQINLANCSISNNTGAEQGGGIYAENSQVNLANASISGNSNGGIACLEGCELSIANSSIRKNTDAAHGGGIYLVSSTLGMTNASVNDNATGGIFARKCGISMMNCSVHEKKAYALDHNEETRLKVVNCSIDGTVIDGTIHGTTRSGRTY